MTRQLYVAAVICGEAAIAEVVTDSDLDSSRIPVRWLGESGLIVSTAPTMAEPIESGSCSGWTFAETYAEAEYLATRAVWNMALRAVDDLLRRGITLPQWMFRSEPTSENEKDNEEGS